MRHPSSANIFKKDVEPTWENKEGSLSSALNWYGINCTSTDSKKYTIQYIKSNISTSDKSKKSDLQILESIPDKYFSNLGFVCRIFMRGGPVQKETITSYLEKIKSHYSKVNKEKPKAQVNKISIQDRISEKTSEIIGEIEGQIDECIMCKNYSLFKPYEWFQKNEVKGVHAKFIKERYQKMYLELDEVINGKDAQLTDGYSNFKKPELKKFRDLINTIIEDCSKIEHNSKVTRKPRKRKTQTVDKIISKIQYKKTDDEYKISSINPSEIVGASQLWVFNAKTRKLGVYISVDANGLSVRGTTVTNFDEKTSIQKTVRKPEDILPKVIKAGKIALRKVLPEINTSEQVLTGRLNSDTILIKALK